MLLSAVYWRYTGCILYVYWLYTGCALAVYWLCTGCILAVYWLCTGCILAVYWLCTGCILAVYWPATPSVRSFTSFLLPITTLISSCSNKNCKFDMKMFYFVAQYTGFTREFFVFKILSCFTVRALVLSHLRP